MPKPRRVKIQAVSNEPIKVPYTVEELRGARPANGSYDYVRLPQVSEYGITSVLIWIGGDQRTWNAIVYMEGHGTPSSTYAYCATTGNYVMINNDTHLEAPTPPSRFCQLAKDVWDAYRAATTTTT